MKNVLIIDESPLFRDFFKEKLDSNGISATVAVNGLDGIAKLRQTVPELLIIDCNLTRTTTKDVLQEKKRDPNTAGIPVIVMADEVNKDRILALAPFNVKKLLTKPLRIDALYAGLEEILGVKIDIDPTPCILEAHVNDQIIFIEAAQGLNHDKIDLLRFKLRELIDLYDIAAPKVLLMITDIAFSFADGPNLELLLGAILKHAEVKPRFMKILTNDKFVADFVGGRKDYQGIEVLNNLQNALDDLLSESPSEIDAIGAQDLISRKILSSGTSADGKPESVQFRFSAERMKANIEGLKSQGVKLSIAVVDDDLVIQELIRAAFKELDAEVFAYPNGREFLASVRTKAFSLVFLDIMMPELSGLDVLERLNAEDLRLPIIVLSAVSKRESVAKAIQLGVRSYLVKPLKPDAIFRKAVEILKPSF